MSPVDVLSLVGDGASVGVVAAIVWLAQKVNHLDAALKDHAKEARAAAMKINYIAGKMGLEELET